MVEAVVCETHLELRVKGSGLRVQGLKCKVYLVQAVVCETHLGSRV